jgi:hypothetical protein
MSAKEKVQLLLKHSLEDPITKILIKNSNLTKTQLETLLIDILTENIAEKSLNYDKKGQFRLTKAPVSRGAFNRTLKQAKQNVTRSIYTILLLGYLGIFENTTLTPYIEVANKLQTYIKTYRELLENTEEETKIHMFNTLRQELEAIITELANP